MWSLARAEARARKVKPSSFRQAWVVFDVHKRMAVAGCCLVKLHFQVTHSGVYCPVSQFHDVMFHLRLTVMLKSVVCTLGGKRQWESCKSGFCKAFVCWVWEIKADSCNISTEGAARTSKSFSFYLTEHPVRSLHQADDVLQPKWSAGRC